MSAFWFVLVTYAVVVIPLREKRCEAGGDVDGRLTARDAFHECPKCGAWVPMRAWIRVVISLLWPVVVLVFAFTVLVGARR